MKKKNKCYLDPLLACFAEMTKFMRPSPRKQNDLYSAGSMSGTLVEPPFDSARREATDFGLEPTERADWAEPTEPAEPFIPFSFRRPSRPF